MSLKKINKVLQKGKSFLVTTHVNPDPDALSSELAMALYLRSKGKKVFVVNEEKIPSRFLFLPKVRTISKLKRGQRINYDAAIIVDCGDLDRIGKVKTLLKEDKPIINIDHHITNEGFADINWVKPKASSTAEILFDMLKAFKFRITKDVAVLLYLGIMTDTGSFRYESTTSHTHAIISELMKFPFSISDLYKKLYESVPHNDLKTFTNVVTKFDSLYGGRVACVELRKSVLSKFSQNFDLRDKIFGFLRSIKNIEVVVILTEDKRHLTRVNLRSQSKFNVATLAHHFNGGGHKKASGCVIEANMKESRRKLLSRLRKML